MHGCFALFRSRHFFDLNLGNFVLVCEDSWPFANV